MQGNLSDAKGRALTNVAFWTTGLLLAVAALELAPDWTKPLDFRAKSSEKNCKMPKTLSKDISHSKRSPEFGERHQDHDRLPNHG